MRALKINKNSIGIGSDSLTAYHNDLRKVKELTKEKEFELLKKMQKGDIEARNKIIEANLRFVTTVAKQSQGNGLPLEELVAVGRIGYFKTAKKFDVKNENKFISYAVWDVRNAIQLAIARVNVVRASITPQLEKIARINNEFELKNERRATKEELIELSGESETQVDNWLFSIKKISRLSDNVYDDSTTTIEEKIPSVGTFPSPDSKLLKEDKKLLVKHLLSLVKNEEDKKILIDYYFHGKFLESIGEELGLTKERIRQRKEKALKKLKMYYQNMINKDILF